MDNYERHVVNALCLEIHTVQEGLSNFYGMLPI